MRGRKRIICLMAFLVVFVLGSETFASVQNSFRSQYKNDTWNVVFTDIQEKYEDKKDFAIRDEYVLQVDVKVEAGNISFLIEGRKSKTSYVDREFTSDKSFYVDANENVSMTVIGEGCKGSFSAEVIKRESAEKISGLEKSDDVQSESKLETQAETAIFTTEESLQTEKSSEKKSEENKESLPEEKNTSYSEVDWYQQLALGKNAAIYDSFLVSDKAVEFVKGNEGLFTEEIDKATVDKLENKDLKYSMIIKDIERYANQITAFRATIDTIEEISGNDGECLTVMKVHYKKKQVFSLIFVGSMTQYVEGQQLKVYAIPLGTAVLSGEMQEESVAFLVSYAEPYKETPWYKKLF